MLPVARTFLLNSPVASSTHLLVLHHALRDTRIFLEAALAAGFTIGRFLAKPNSVDSSALIDIKRLGIQCEEEPSGTSPPYSHYEASGFLDGVLFHEAQAAQAGGRRIVIIDVGGYFAGPLLRASPATIQAVAGVVEVTTFGHNRYLTAASGITVPVYSQARSPLKDAEAGHVGESVARATEDILQEVGLTLNARKCGVIGYGMIGQRIADALSRRGVDVTVSDNNPSVSVGARLYQYRTAQITTLLQNTEIVISATGSQAVAASELQVASDGLLLVSGGSRANEFDIQGIQTLATRDQALSPLLHKYWMPWNKAVVVANSGKAVNFLKGGSPEEVMDLVFSETAECIRFASQSNGPLGAVQELGASTRDAISQAWLAQQANGLDIFKA